MRTLLGRLGPLSLVLVLTSSAPLMTACSDGPTGPSGTCCKVCRSGKACGDTCIAKDKTCNTSGGCACNG